MNATTSIRFAALSGLFLLSASAWGTGLTSKCTSSSSCLGAIDKISVLDTGGSSSVTLAQCESADPSSIPAGCQQLLASEVNRQRVNDLALTRSMYRPDPHAYPADLSSTTAANLLPHPGVANDVNTSKTKLANDTELAYRALLTHDWANAKGGSLSTRSSVSSWQEHPWLGSESGASDRATSCQEYVWRKWNTGYLARTGVSTTLDLGAACGNDAACLMTNTFYDPGSPFYAGGATTSIPATPARTATNVGIAFRTNTVVKKNPFYDVSALMLLDQNVATRIAWNNFSQATCPDGLQGPFVPSPNSYSLFTPSRYSGQGVASKMSTLVDALNHPSVYVIGDGFALLGSRIVARYATEKDMIVDLWGKRSIGGAPVVYANDSPFEIATRQRVDRLRELEKLYAQLTHFPCGTRLATSGSSGSGSGGKSSSGTSSGGGSSGGGGDSSSSGGKRGGGHAYEAPMHGKQAIDLSTIDLEGLRETAARAQSVLAPKLAAAMTIDLDEAIAAAAVVQDEIVSFMLEEIDRGDDGCYGPNQTMCDVDPFEVTNRVLHSFDDEQEADFQECVEWTSNRLTTSTVAGADALISGKIAAAKAKLLAAPGVSSQASTNAPSMARSLVTDAATASIGQIVTGSRYLGDADLAGGGYSYGAYWKVTPKDFSGPPSNGAATACELDGEIHGELHGRVDLLKSVAEPFCSPFDGALDDAAAHGKGYDDPAIAAMIGVKQIPVIGDLAKFCELRYRMRHLADAHLTVQDNPTNGTYDGQLFFGGVQLWSESGSAATPNISASWPASPIEIQGPSATVVIVVVPVTFEVNGEIQYGADATAQLGSVRKCGAPTIGASASFTPWVTADAIGSVGIGFSFAQIGVRGKVRVLDAKLPLNVFTRVAQNSSGTYELQAGAHANLNLSMLGGTLSAFAEVSIGPLDEEVEKQLASWDGLHDTVGILNKDLDPIPLPIFDQNAWNEYQAAVLAQQ